MFTKSFKNILFFIILFVCNIANAQYNLIFTEDKNLLKLIEQIPQDGKSLLVFKSNLDLKFESSSFNFTKVPEFKNGFYILELPAISQAITVFYNESPSVLNFGMIQEEFNSYPKFKSGEVRCFNIDIKLELEYSDITANEQKKGNLITPMGPNVSDALLIIRLFPIDLELDIKESNNYISKIEKKGGSYNLFLKMIDDKNIKNYNFLIKAKQTDEIIITLPKLSPKAVVFYRIRKPVVEMPNNEEHNNKITQVQNNETKISNVVPEPENNIKKTENIEENINKNDYRKKIIGYYAGSLGDDKTYMEFTDIDLKRNTIIGRIFIDGVYMNFKGFINFKSEKDYYASLKIVKDDILNYDGILDIHCKSGILNGVLIDENNNLREFSVINTSYILKDNTNEIKQNIVNINNKLAGNWLTQTKNLYLDEILIDNISFDKVTTIHFIKNNNYLINLKGKLKNNQDNFTFIFPNINYPGIPQPVTITLIINPNNSNLTLMSDDASFFENIKIQRNNLKLNKNNSIANSNDDYIYYVAKNKSYFYNTPDFQDPKKSYLIIGQIPKTLNTYLSSDFLYASYLYNGKVTKGYLLKSDLKKFDLKYFLQTEWEGKFGTKNIKIIIEQIYWDKEELIVKGYNMLNDKKRSLSGTIISINESGIKINLNEPGDDEWDGIFKINFDMLNNCKGEWISNNGKLNREFTLRKNEWKK